MMEAKFGGERGNPTELVVPVKGMIKYGNLDTSGTDGCRSCGHRLLVVLVAFFRLTSPEKNHPQDR
jgi:hypothetical protein